MRQTCSKLAMAAVLAGALGALSAWQPAQAQPAAGAPVADDSVYRAFGGKAGIRALMDDFFVRLQADARIGRFFRDSNREHLVSQLTDQVCQETGGPCRYAGVPMDLAHESMEIGRADFLALVEVLQDSMDARGVPFWAQNRLLARLAPMHREIVTRP